MKSILTLIISLSFISQNYAQNCPETVFTGEGTYYGYAGGGNCSLPYDVKDFYTGALNHTQYKTAELCGACVEITGKKGKINISIVDQCPECKEGDIDLNENIFDLIDDKINGRVPISWKIIPCSAYKNFSFYFKEGSSEFWTAVQIRDALFPVTKLEIKINNTFIDIPKVDYNYFIKPDGFGKGPYSFRLTDIRSEVIVQENIPLLLQQPISGNKQFINCVTTVLPHFQNQILELKIESHLYQIPNLNSNSPIQYELYNMNGVQVTSGTSLNSSIEFQNNLTGIYILKLIQFGKTEFLKIALT